MPFISETRLDAPDAFDTPGQNELITTMVTGTLIDYVLKWEAGDNVIDGTVIPVRFVLSRADGQEISLTNTDIAILSVTNPNAMPEQSPQIYVSTLQGTQIAFACLFQYADKGLYTFAMFVEHDGQVVTARHRVHVF